MSDTSMSIEVQKVLVTRLYPFRTLGNTIKLPLSGTSFVRQPAFYGRPATKCTYILVYFMAVPPCAECGSNFELFTACFLRLLAHLRLEKHHLAIVYSFWCGLTPIIVCFLSTFELDMLCLYEDNVSNVLRKHAIIGVKYPK